MTQFLYRRFQEQGWLQEDQKVEESAPLGMVMRVEQDGMKFIAEPPNVDSNLKIISAKLNLAVLFTMSSDITSLFFTQIPRGDTEITLIPHNITVPVADTLEEVMNDSGGVKRRDFCCFVRDQKIVLIWSASADGIMLQGADVESKLMSSVRRLLQIAYGILRSKIWGVPIPETPLTLQQGRNQTTLVNTPHAQQTPSVHSRRSVAQSQLSEKGLQNLAILDEIDLGAEDEESLATPSRPFLLTHSVLVGLAMCLLMVIECLAARLIVIEVHALGKVAFSRFALLATLPIFMFFTLFFTIVVIGTVFQVFGPMTDVKTGNSRYYSSRAPNIKRHPNIQFPHITVQMPVYKEGLKGVIIPTINSLIGAIRHYVCEISD